MEGISRPTRRSVLAPAAAFYLPYVATPEEPELCPANILLIAEDLNLCAVPLGGFCDLELGRQLGLSDMQQEAVIYVVVVGRPATGKTT